MDGASEAEPAFLTVMASPPAPVATLSPYDGFVLLGGVDFPEGLLAAHRERRLVVFAGAGISRPAPTGIPIFKDIVSVIEGESAEPRRKSEAFDAYLGRVQATGFGVHVRVEQILGASGPPNDMHKAVLSIFPTAESVRIVTTNYDRSLSIAAADRWSDEIRDFAAPTLPLAERFSGIVYLHGMHGEDPGDLVLTDSDFGRAYLTPDPPILVV
jgi:hypothetical protein